MTHFINVWKKYATFSGRATRTEYWTYTALNILIQLGLIGVGAAIAATGRQSMQVPLLMVMLGYGVYVLASFVPSLAVTVRRLHDTDRSGWWFLLAFVPIANIANLVFLLSPSTPGPNQFGSLDGGEGTPAILPQGAQTEAL